MMERLALVHDDTEDIAALVHNFIYDDYSVLNNANPDNLISQEKNSVDLTNEESPRENINKDMKYMKKQLATTTLEACGGNKSKAAKQLGIARYTLDKYLRGFKPEVQLL